MDPVTSPRSFVSRILPCLAPSIVVGALNALLVAALFMGAACGEPTEEDGDVFPVADVMVQPGAGRITPWLHGITDNNYGRDMLSRVPGMGAVLYWDNYDLAKTPGDWIAITINEGSNKMLLKAVEEGARFIAVLVHDEVNQEGPSGRYMTPADYKKLYRGLYTPLREAGLNVSTVGIAPVGGWWWQVNWNLDFDDAYMDQLVRMSDPTRNILSQYHAFNPNKVPWEETARAMNKYGKSWILSPAPFNDGGYQNQPIKPDRWVEISRDSRVLAVAPWQVIETEGQYGMHGLMDWHGRLTQTGREMMRAMPCPGCSPEYGGSGDVHEYADCPRDQVLVGFEGKSGGVVDSIGPRCAPFHDVTVGATMRRGAIGQARRFGGGGGAPFVADCPENAFVSGIEMATGHSGLTGQAPMWFRPTCASWVTTAQGGAKKLIDRGFGPTVGRSPGHPQPVHACPGGRGARGLHGRHNDSVLGTLQLRCR